MPFLLYFFGYLVAALIEFVRAYPKARGVERKRIRLLLIAFGVAYFGCVDYLPKFGISIYPFGYAAILGFVFIVAIMFRKSHVLALAVAIGGAIVFQLLFDTALGVTLPLGFGW